MEIEKVLAMAVAAVAKENEIGSERVIVKSFKEVQKSSLEKYIDDNHIVYHKYKLEGSKE